MKDTCVSADRRIFRFAAIMLRLKAFPSSVQFIAVVLRSISAGILVLSPYRY